MTDTPIVGEGSFDLLYGRRAIAEYIGLSEGQTQGLLQGGHLPAFKLGGRVCSRRSVLDRWLNDRLPPVREA